MSFVVLLFLACWLWFVGSCYIGCRLSFVVCSVLFLVLWLLLFGCVLLCILCWFVFVVRCSFILVGCWAVVVRFVSCDVCRVL